MNSPSLSQEHFILKIHKKVNLLFWVSFVLIAFINVMKQPALNIYGELIGEMGNPYFRDAKFAPIWENLTTVVAAYIPLTERILALLCVRVLGLEHIYPWFVQGGCVLLIAGCCSLVNLSAFKKIIDDDIIRFMIALLMGSCVYFDGMKLYNAPYIGSMFILWSIFLDKEKMSFLKLFLLFSGMFVLLLGKAHYISFAPVHLYLCYTAFKSKHKKTFVFYILVLLVQLLQLMVTLSVKAKWEKAYANLGTVSVSDIIDYAFRYFFYNATALGGNFLIIKGGGIVVAAIALLMLWCAYRIYRKSTNVNMFFLILTCAVVALTSIAITIKGFPDYATEAKLQEHLVFHYRHFLFSDTLIVCFVCTLIYGMLKKEWARLAIAGLLVVMMVNKNVFPEHNPAETPSKWEIYHTLLNEEDFFIPTWTYNSWILRRNSEKLSEFSINSSIDGITLNELKKVFKNIDPASWKLRGFMMAQQSGYQNSTEPISAVAIDAKGQIISKAESMTPPHYKFQYFRFPDFIMPAHIVFSDSNNQRKKIPAGHFMFFGQKKDEAKPSK